ncbi:MAG: S-methyl-5'-thioinosine phosphorylase [Lysobacterales bacterium]|nr:MAG: S-methyl-5'-thioinosine phosphorylase [Xanthomonadales bacterium]
MTARLTLALVGGTGLTELEEDSGKGLETLDIDTPYGQPSAPIRVVATEPLRLLFLPRHGNPHRFPPHCVNYRANLWALREAGADHVLAVYAVGGLHEPYRPGVLAAANQLIDYTWGRTHTYSDSEHAPLRHVDFTRPFDGSLRLTLLAAARHAALDLVDGGCIGVFQGPRLESAAEIERARRDGCNMAGMTALPEAGLARELGLDYAGLGVISNWGAGVRGEHLAADAFAASLHEPMARVRRLVAAVAELLSKGMNAR